MRSRPSTVMYSFFLQPFSFWREVEKLFSDRPLGVHGSVKERPALSVYLWWYYNMVLTLVKFCQTCKCTLLPSTVKYMSEKVIINVELTAALT